jgi:hypothetical protein
MTRCLSVVSLLGAFLTLALACILALPVLSSLGTSQPHVSRPIALGHPQTDPLAVTRDQCCVSRLFAQGAVQIGNQQFLVFDYLNSSAAVFEPRFGSQVFEIETQNHMFRPVNNWLLIAEIYWRHQLKKVPGNPLGINIMKTEGLAPPGIDCSPAKTAMLQLLRLSNSPLEAYWHLSCESKEWQQLYDLARVLSHVGFVWPTTYRINGKHLIVDQSVPLAFFLDNLDQRHCLFLTVEVISRAQKGIRSLEIMYVNPFPLGEKWVAEKSGSYSGFLRTEAETVSRLDTFKNELGSSFAKCTNLALVSPALGGKEE